MLFFISACYLAAGEPQRNLKKCNTVIISKNKKIDIEIELAISRDQKNKGLMFRKKMDLNSGMLFVYNKEKYLNFWMKNTYLPLSIAYIDRNGIIKQILRMKPLDTSITYPSMYPVKYALEMNSGWFKKNGIKTGDRIILNGCFSK